jgi:CHAT domain-containing protein
MKNFKYILVVVFITICAFDCKCQDISETSRIFWKAVDGNDDSNVVKNGLVLIDFIKNQNFEIDTNIFEIRLYTAISLSVIGEYNKSINLFTETYSQVVNKWGMSNEYCAILYEYLGVNYSLISNHSKALDFLLQSSEVYLQLVGAENLDYTRVLNSIANLYSKLGVYEESLKFHLKSYFILARLLGEGHLLVVKKLNNLADCYWHLGDLYLAEEYGLKAKLFSEKLNGMDRIVLGRSLNILAQIYMDQSEIDLAVDIQSQSLKITKEFLGDKCAEYATVLSNLAEIYSKKGNYSEALNLNTNALQIRKSLFGEISQDVAISLNNISTVRLALGQYSEAKDGFNKALLIQKQLFGENHPEYAMTLNNLAQVFSELGDFQTALNLNGQSLKIRQSTLGLNHPDCIMSLNNIGVDYSSLGEFSKGLKYHKQALEILEKRYGKRHIQYAISLNNLAQSYEQLGDYPKALKLTQESLLIKLEKFGEDHFGCSIGFGNLAMLYLDLGEPTKALECQLKSIDIVEKTFGKSHPNYAQSLNNLASIYSALGDFDLALEAQLNAIIIVENSFGQEHPDFALILNNTAITYLDLGYYTKALNSQMKALDIWKKIYGKESESVALVFNNISETYSEMGDFSNAQKYQLMSLKIREKLYGKNSANCMPNINNIGVTLLRLCDYSNALLRFERLLKMQEFILSDYHPAYAATLTALAILTLREGQVNRAIEFQHRSYAIRERSFFNNRFGLDPNLVVSIKDELNNSFYATSSFIFCDSLLSNFASRSWLNLNGIVGSEASNLESQIESSGDTAMVHLLADLKLNKKQLANYRELTKEEKTSRGIDEKTLEEKVAKQEREISKHSKAFSDFNRRFNLKDVSSALKGDEVFVDIARVPYFSTYTNQWTDSVKYLVFIHDAKDSLVDYRFIDNGKELEGDVFSDYKIDCSNQANATDLKNALYYNSFWKPIADKIGSSKTVYVSLGGVYNNINLNTLYNPETGKYLVEEKDIRIVNNARDFILSKEQAARTYTSTSTALYGFPDYNGIETITKDTTDYLSLTRDLDPLWIDSLTRGGLKAAPLPATKIEVEQIAKSFEENGWQVSEYLGDKASETNIKQEESPRVLHIATHGYFFDDIPTDKSNNERFLGMDRQRVVQDPMLRSGLLFTGANKTLQGEKVDGENGLLSASEASLLNLRGTELVVLSACETGKGEVKNSEGVYGLRKAFSDAGAANTIMSLWKVDDKVTQEFMTRYYEIWLNEKTSIREAFNRTQLVIKAKYPQPYYWGAFVLVGS